MLMPPAPAYHRFLTNPSSSSTVLEYDKHNISLGNMEITEMITLIMIIII